MQLLRLQTSESVVTSRIEAVSYQYDGPPGEETLIDLCDYIVGIADQTHAYELHIGPLASGSSLLTLRPEFSMAVQQLPYVIQALNNDNVSECFIGFYEQGANLRLKFTIDEGFSVDAHCYRSKFADMASATAVGEIERFKRRTDLIVQLQNFGRDIFAMVTRVCPGVLDHPLLVDWKKSVGI